MPLSSYTPLSNEHGLGVQVDLHPKDPTRSSNSKEQLPPTLAQEAGLDPMDVSYAVDLHSWRSVSKQKSCVFQANEER